MWTRLDLADTTLSEVERSTFVTYRHTCGWRVESDDQTLSFSQATYSTEPVVFRASLTSSPGHWTLGVVEVALDQLVSYGEKLTNDAVRTMFEALFEHFAHPSIGVDGCVRQVEATVTRI